MIDYQWPSQLLEHPKFEQGLGQSKNKDKAKEIEDFFSERFNCKAWLFSSGRAAIAALIEFYNINRSHFVYTSKWSSHCLFNTIGAFTNPTINFHEPIRMNIVNHKWGRIVECKKSYDNCITLEDSIDSIFLSSNTLFPNNGDYELISFPKIIGSYSGAILFSRNEAFNKRKHNFEEQNIDFVINQSRLKNIHARGEHDFRETYLYHEPWNRSIDAFGLNDILERLPNYDLNKDIILKRHEILCSHFGVEPQFNEERIGPVFILPSKKYRKGEGSQIMERHHSFEKFAEEALYEKVLLLPLHFGVSDDLFHRYYKDIREA